MLYINASHHSNDINNYNIIIDILNKIKINNNYLINM